MNPGSITFFRSHEEAQQFKVAPTNNEPPAVASDDITLLRAADHPAAPVEWLWPGRIPIGKVTLVVGDPGLGKSLVAIDVAARTTRNAAWPDEQRQGDKETGRLGGALSNPFLSLSPCLPVSLSSSPIAECDESRHSTPGSVLILSAEDDLADTIRPRLDAAGADPYRVYTLPTIADLRLDVGRLRDAVERIDNCRLIVVDPLNAYVGPSDSHFHTVIRRVLAPLTRLAREKRLAVLAIAHIRKAHGPAIHRTAGSLAFVAASRALWTIVRDPAQPTRNLFVPLKHSLTPAACGLAFKIESHTESGEPVIAWDPTPLTLPPEVLLTPPPKPRHSPERLAAQVWLTGALAAGPRPARDMLEEGHARGLRPRTLQLALHELGGTITKRGLSHGWWWSLDGFDTTNVTKPVEPNQDDTPKSDCAFECATGEPPSFTFPDPQLDQDLQRILHADAAIDCAIYDPERIDREVQEAIAKLNRITA